MDTPGGDHVAAVAADIDSLAKATGGVAHPNALAQKITVASLASLDCDRLWKAAVLRLQPFRLALPSSPSTSRTKMPDDCPVAMPMLASGHLFHQALMTVRSVVASLTPFGVRGCLPG